MTVNLMQACECMSTQPSVNARRAWLDACAAFEDARVTCGNPDLLRMAAFLERVATALWASDIRTGRSTSPVTANSWSIACCRPSSRLSCERRRRRPGGRWRAFLCAAFLARASKLL